MQTASLKSHSIGQWGVAAAWWFASAATAHAHELVRIHAFTPEVEVSQVARIAVTLRARDGVPGCGLEVDYGDGAVEFLRVAGTNPSGVIQHAFQKPGAMTVKVYPHTQFKGLGTTFACSGSLQAISIRVLPAGTAANRAAQEVARQAAIDRERAEANAAVQRAQAQADAAKAEALHRRTLAEQASQRERMARAVAMTAPVVSPSADQAKNKPAESKAKSALDL